EAGFREEDRGKGIGLENGGEKDGREKGGQGCKEKSGRESAFIAPRTGFAWERPWPRGCGSCRVRPEGIAAMAAPTRRAPLHALVDTASIATAATFFRVLQVGAQPRRRLRFTGTGDLVALAARMAGRRVFPAG